MSPGPRTPVVAATAVIMYTPTLVRPTLIRGGGGGGVARWRSCGTILALVLRCGAPGHPGLTAKPPVLRGPNAPQMRV